MKLKKHIASVVKSILITHFQITETTFDWDTPLYLLDSQFKLLGHIETLQVLLAKALKQNIFKKTDLNGFVSSPNDIVDFIVKNSK